MTRVPYWHSHSWSVLELIPEELVTFLYVQNHILICWTHLIIHFPCSIDYLERPSLNKLPCPTLVIVILAKKPVAEIFSLIMGESSWWIRPQGVDYSLENIWEMILNELRLRPREEVIDRLEEGCIIRVRNYVHYQFFMVFLCCDRWQTQRQECRA